MGNSDYAKTESGSVSDSVFTVMLLPCGRWVEIGNCVPSFQFSVHPGINPDEERNGDRCEETHPEKTAGGRIVEDSGK